MKQQKYLILLLLIVISGCASAPQTTRLPQAEPPPLEDGWGRMFVTAGIAGGVQLWSKHQVGPFLINDKEVGSTAKGEYLLVDLRPGIYKATCTQHEPFDTTDLPIELQINAGEQRHFACDMAFADEMDSLAEELILPGGVRGFMSIASGTVSFLKERPVDLYDSILSSYTKFNGISDSQQSISPDREIQKDSSSASEGETPSSEAAVTANVTNAANQSNLGSGITGTYKSEITKSGSFAGQYFTKKEYQELVITLKQNGNIITGTDSYNSAVIEGTLDGDNIVFTYWSPNRKIAGGLELRGTWKINPDGHTLEGKWWMGGSTDGKWDLTRIE